MAYVIKVPSELIEVHVQAEMVYVTITAQLQDDATAKVVATQSFSGAVNKKRTDVKGVLKAQLIQQIKEWKQKLADERTVRQTQLATFSAELEAGV